MAISVYELAKLKAEFSALKTEENEIKTLKLAADFDFLVIPGSRK